MLNRGLAFFGREKKTEPTEPNVPVCRNIAVAIVASAAGQETLYHVCRTFLSTSLHGPPTTLHSLSTVPLAFPAFLDP